jgi:acetyl-CoA carboxylase biotin carboxyl carrier protein
MRVSVRRADEPSTAIPLGASQPPLETEVDAAPAVPPPTDGLTRIEAPMVGVFYRAPQPGAPAFVDIGDTVVPGQVLCIIEAMKLFNELKAETSGVVRTILVENAQPVEFEQLLFELEPVLTPPAV